MSKMNGEDISSEAMCGARERMQKTCEDVPTNLLLAHGRKPQVCGPPTLYVSFSVVGFERSAAPCSTLRPTKCSRFKSGCLANHVCPPWCGPMVPHSALHFCFLIHMVRPRFTRTVYHTDSLTSAMMFLHRIWVALKSLGDSAAKSVAQVMWKSKQVKRNCKSAFTQDSKVYVLEIALALVFRFVPSLPFSSRAQANITRMDPTAPPFVPTGIDHSLLVQAQKSPVRPASLATGKSILALQTELGPPRQRAARVYHLAIFLSLRARLLSKQNTHTMADSARSTSYTPRNKRSSNGPEPSPADKYPEDSPVRMRPPRRLPAQGIDVDDTEAFPALGEAAKQPARALRTTIGSAAPGLESQRAPAFPKPSAYRAQQQPGSTSQDQQQLERAREPPSTSKPQQQGSLSSGVDVNPTYDFSRLEASQQAQRLSTLAQLQTAFSEPPSR